MTPYGVTKQDAESATGRYLNQYVDPDPRHHVASLVHSVLQFCPTKTYQEFLPGWVTWLHRRLQNVLYQTTVVSKVRSDDDGLVGCGSMDI